MNSHKKTFLSFAFLSAALGLGGCMLTAAPENSNEPAKTVPASQTAPSVPAAAPSTMPPPPQGLRRQAPADDPEIKAIQEEISKIQRQKAKIDASLALLAAKRDQELLPQQLEKMRLDSARAQRAAEFAKKMAELEEERAKLERELGLSTARSNAKLHSKQVELAKLETENRELQMEIADVAAQYKSPTAIVDKQRELSKIAVSAQPKYLKDPFVDGTLYISDRRIDFDGPVTQGVAESVIDQINFFNNRNSEYPIFLVITDSPGGSVSAGYQIQKAMQSSKSPVYVVVKGMAASMAAVIATTAERSFCFENTMILHHQISTGVQGNLTILRENVELAGRWYKIFGEPVAKKMGLSLEEFTKQMYEHNSNGDWTEYGDGAAKLKWIDQVVDRIEDTSVVSIAENEKPSAQIMRISGNAQLKEKTDSQGKRYVELPPLLNPMDCWWISDRNGYYRAK